MLNVPSVPSNLFRYKEDVAKTGVLRVPAGMSILSLSQQREELLLKLKKLDELRSAVSYSFLDPHDSNRLYTKTLHYFGTVAQKVERVDSFFTKGDVTFFRLQQVANSTGHEINKVVEEWNRIQMAKASALPLYEQKKEEFIAHLLSVFPLRCEADWVKEKLGYHALLQTSRSVEWIHWENQLLKFRLQSLSKEDQLDLVDSWAMLKARERGGHFVPFKALEKEEEDATKFCSEHIRMYVARDLATFDWKVLRLEEDERLTVKTSELVIENKACYSFKVVNPVESTTENGLSWIDAHK